MLATSLLSAHVLLKQCLACDVLYFPHDSDPSSITSWISQLVAAISESCERRAPDHIYVIWIPQNRVIKILQTQHYKLNASQNSTNSTSYPNTTNSISFRLHAPVLLQPSLECDVIMMSALLALSENKVVIASGTLVLLVCLTTLSKWRWVLLQPTLTSCKVAQQHTATRCETLQRTVCCSVLHRVLL